MAACVWKLWMLFAALALAAGASDLAPAQGNDVNFFFGLPNTACINAMKKPQMVFSFSPVSDGTDLQDGSCFFSCSQHHWAI